MWKKRYLKIYMLWQLRFRQLKWHFTCINFLQCEDVSQYLRMLPFWTLIVFSSISNAHIRYAQFNLSWYFTKNVSVICIRRIFHIFLWHIIIISNITVLPADSNKNLRSWEHYQGFQHSFSHHYLRLFASLQFSQSRIRNRTASKKHCQQLQFNNKHNLC